MRDQKREGGGDRSRGVGRGLVIGADLDAVDRERAFERRINSGGVERHRALALQVEHQRLLRFPIA